MRPAPGQPLDFTYRLHWQGMQQEQHPPGAWVMQTRVGPRLRRAGRRRAAICRRLHRPIARRAAGRCSGESRRYCAGERTGHGEQRIPGGSNRRVAHDGASEAAGPQRSRPSCADSFRAATMCSRRRGATSCRRCCNDEAARSYCHRLLAARQRSRRRDTAKASSHACRAARHRHAGPRSANARDLRPQSSSTIRPISWTSVPESCAARRLQSPMAWRDCGSRT